MRLDLNSDEIIKISDGLTHVAVINDTVLAAGDNGIIYKLYGNGGMYRFL